MDLVAYFRVMVWVYLVSGLCLRGWAGMIVVFVRFVVFWLRVGGCWLVIWVPVVYLFAGDLCCFVWVIVLVVGAHRLLVRGLSCSLVFGCCVVSGGELLGCCGLFVGCLAVVVLGYECGWDGCFD